VAVALAGPYASLHLAPDRRLVPLSVNNNDYKLLQYWRPEAASLLRPATTVENIDRGEPEHAEV